MNEHLSAGTLAGDVSMIAFVSSSRNQAYAQEDCFRTLREDQERAHAKRIEITEARRFVSLFSIRFVCNSLSADERARFRRHRSRRVAATAATSPGCR